MSLIWLLTATQETGALGQASYGANTVAPQRPLEDSKSLEQEIQIPRSLHPHLQWWTQETNILSGQPLHPLHHPLQVFTDTSNEGWGAHLGDLSASGSWSVPESLLNINFLELKAILLALKRFQHVHSQSKSKGSLAQWRYELRLVRDTQTEQSMT